MIAFTKNLTSSGSSGRVVQTVRGASHPDAGAAPATLVAVAPPSQTSASDTTCSRPRSSASGPYGAASAPPPPPPAPPFAGASHMTSAKRSSSATFAPLARGPPLPSRCGRGASAPRTRQRVPLAACATHVSSGSTSFGSSGSQFGGSDVGPYDQEPSSKYLSATRRIHNAMMR